MANKKLRYQCWKCLERFKSWQERDRHMEFEHPAPRIITERIKRYNECHSLIGGRELQLGEKIHFAKTGVITKIIKTEGSQNVQIEIAVISDVYNKDN